VVLVTAPVRVADLGGWTDTWFAGHGAVCHLAVGPGTTVEIEAAPAAAGPSLIVDLHDFGERHALPDDGAFSARHPLLAAAFGAAAPPADRSCVVRLSCAAPPGASTGTSASVVVALLAAFDVLRGAPLDPAALARRAHRVEVEQLGQESGIQDQIAAAYGGINFVEMPRYPDAVVTRLALAPDVRAALGRRLLHVYLGRSHESWSVHRDVIASLAGGANARDRLEPLRGLARQGRDALRAGDLAAYGRALSANTDAQAALHHALVGAAARQVIALARAHGAAGWKVNGAGGDGGSVTVLCGPADHARAGLAEALQRGRPGLRILPLELCGTGVHAAP
jgi:D-glycero-alpha-D-manno-heptose-7-phosphate kinase